MATRFVGLACQITQLAKQLKLLCRELVEVVGLGMIQIDKPAHASAGLKWQQRERISRFQGLVPGGNGFLNAVGRQIADNNIFAGLHGPAEHAAGTVQRELKLFEQGFHFFAHGIAGLDGLLGFQTAAQQYPVASGTVVNRSEYFADQFVEIVFTASE